MTPAAERRRPQVWTRPWKLALAGCAALLVAIYIVGLAWAPPSMAWDEAATAYNSWAIGHFGVDEYGRAMPLYFESFGDFNSPVYYYLLAPLTRVLPLTPYVVRLPAALLVLATCGLAGLTAWRLTGSRPAVTLTVLTAGLMPWLVMQGRFAGEPVTLIFSLTVMVWCLVRAETGGGRGWFLGSGVALAIAVFAYAPGRLMVALLAAVLVVVHLPRPRRPGWSLSLLPVAPAYVVLAAWTLAHPGSLTARFSNISILSGGGPVEVVLRFAINYLTYFSPPYLMLWGDTNPQHGTAVGGYVMLASFPAMIAGAIYCWRHRGQVLARFVLISILVAPIPAALTQESVPHGPRSGPMIPFLVLLAAFGWMELLPRLRGRTGLARALVALALFQAVLFFSDLYLTYPLRAQKAFHAGVAGSILRAHQLSGDHVAWLSSDLIQPYIQAAVALTPDPGRGVKAALADLRIRQAGPGDLFAAAGAGDLVVAAPSDRPPAGVTLVFEDRVPGPWPWSSPRLVASVYRT